MTGKRKQRKICDWVLSAVIAAAVWGLMVTGLFCMGIYRTDRLNEWISESSYLEERYAAFEQKVRETLAEAELPEDLLEGEEFHDRFLTDLKKQILGNASQTPETWFGNLAEERIGEYLLDLNVYTTELSDEGLFALANNLQSIERVYTEIPEIGTWREWQTDVLKNGRSLALASGIILLAALAVAVGIQHRKSRVLDIGGIGGLAGSILLAVSVAVFLILRDSSGSEMAEIFWKETVRLAASMSAAGAGVSVCLWMTGRLCRRVKR